MCMYMYMWCFYLCNSIIMENAILREPTIPSFSLDFCCWYNNMEIKPPIVSHSMLYCNHLMNSGVADLPSTSLTRRRWRCPNAPLLKAEPPIPLPLHSSLPQILPLPRFRLLGVNGWRVVSRDCYLVAVRRRQQLQRNSWMLIMYTRCRELLGLGYWLHRVSVTSHTYINSLVPRPHPTLFKCCTQ